MALLNKRSRNIEGLLASRLGDQDAPMLVQDRGKHGNLMSNRTVRYGTKGQEGRNFLKAVDKYHNYEDWNKDLGGGQNFMQGPSSSGKDRILGMLPDSEALDDFATDKASEEGGGPNWDDLPSFQKVDAANQAMLDAQIMDKGNVGEAEGAEAGDRRQQFQDMSKRLNLPGISDKISKSQMSEDQLRMMGPQYEKTSMGAAYLDEGESELDRIGRENMLEAGLNEELGPDKIDKQSGFGERLSQGRIGDAFSGLFSSDDDEGGGKKKKKMSKEAMKYGGDLLKGMMQEPAQSKRQMPTSKVTRGSVPFAGLLAQKAQRQRNPYFTPRGLV